MRIFVTGATGVIGRRAVPLMVCRGHEVTGVGRSPERLKTLERAGASPLVLDLLDREAVRRSIAGFDAIVNLATHIPPLGLKSFFASAWKETGRIREHGSALLVDEALASGAQLFVQESFAPIYPDSGDRWITEETRPQAATYNEATLKAEASADRFSKDGGRGVVLRFAYFYGPGDGFTQETFKAVRRGWLPIFGRHDGFFSTVNHEDAALAVVAALDAPAGIYNVVDNVPLTRRQLGDALSKMLNVPPPRIPPAWLTRLTGSVGNTMARSLRISNAKLRGTTAWTPRYATELEGWRAAFQGEQPSSIEG
jgi:2-alkyl-3-oxoalkanoate reductase